MTGQKVFVRSILSFWVLIMVKTKSQQSTRRIMAIKYLSYSRVCRHTALDKHGVVYLNVLTSKILRKVCTAPTWMR